MKRIILLSIALSGVLFTASCGEKNPIGSPLEIKKDYTLPEGGASAWSEQWIQEIHENYGSYFIYKPTQTDFEWRYGAAESTTLPDSIFAGDPQYVEGLLKFLDDIWIRHLPEDFKKKLGIPYRVLLADKLQSPSKATFESKVTDLSIAFSGVNADFANLTPTQKKAKMDAFNTSIWTDYYAANGLIGFPEEFFEVTDYNDTSLSTAVSFFPEGLEAIRQAGFIKGWFVQGYNPNPQYVEWWTYNLYQTEGRARDQKSFMDHLLRTPDSSPELAQFLTYPKIARKWQILIDFFNEEYGIDMRAIANTVFAE